MAAFVGVAGLGDVGVGVLVDRITLEVCTDDAIGDVISVGNDATSILDQRYNVRRKVFFFYLLIFHAVLVRHSVALLEWNYTGVQK